MSQSSLDSVFISVFCLTFVGATEVCFVLTGHFLPFKSQHGSFVRSELMISNIATSCLVYFLYFTAKLCFNSS